MNRAALTISLVTVLSCLPTGLAAETTYVIDKLLVGVHQEKDLDSAIIKVLPTGTRLEVLRRDGELAYIEDPDRTRGWVDTAYLTVEQPAQLRIAELERKNGALQARIQALTQQPAAAAPGADNTAELRTADLRIETLTKENTDLKGKLSDVRVRAEKLQTANTALRAEVRQTEIPPDVRVAELERIRDELGDSLDDARKRITELEAQASKDDVAALLPIVLEAYATTLLAIVAAIAVLAFIFGIYCMDFLIRKRHGGFRV
jgi:SH3 domain protein